MPTPTLLTLPPELRHQIYTYLTPPTPTSYPHALSPLTSISHLPAPLPLHLTCRALATDLAAHFYSTATLRFVAPTCNIVYSAGNYDACVRAVRRAKRVEVVVVWERRRESWGVSGWVGDVVEMLGREGRELDVVVLSVRDVWGKEVGWGVKEGVLAPLRELMGRVRWVIGEAMASDEMRERVREFVGGLNDTRGRTISEVSQDTDDGHA